MILRFIFLLTALWMLPLEGHAATWTMAGCTQTELGNILANPTFAQGDSIVFGPGTCQYNNPPLTSNKIFSLSGNSSCPTDADGRAVTPCATIIQDNVFKSQGPCPGVNCSCNRTLSDNVRGAPFLTMTSTTDQNITWRWHDFQIVGQATDPGVCSTHVQFSSFSHSFRVDHIPISTPQSQIFTTGGDMRGVFDHNTNGDPGQSQHKTLVYCDHSNWGGVGNHGDNSFAQPTVLGTIDAIFIEDNTVNDDANQGAGIMDGAHGCRVVVRKNKLSFLGTHGTESTGNDRGIRQWEIYQNQFVAQTGGDTSASLIRSGTGVFWGNDLRCKNNNCNANTGGGGYDHLAVFINFRDMDPYNQWGACSGVNVWDKNDGVLYKSGTAQTGSTTDHLVDAGFGTYTTGDYIVRNTTQNWSSIVTANTSTTIDTAQSPQASFLHGWAVNDSYEVRKAYPCLDQVGRGQSDMLGDDVSGNRIDTLTGTATWPNQLLDQAYQWGNTIACPLPPSDVCGSTAQGTISSTPILTSSSNHILAGREYFDNVQKPGYTPFTYPHPLVSGGGGGPPPTVTPQWSPIINLRTAQLDFSVPTAEESFLTKTGGVQ